MKIEKIPGIFQENEWEVLQIKSNVDDGILKSLEKFGIDGDAEINNALDSEIKSQLTKLIFDSLNKTFIVKRKLLISVIEEAPSESNLIMNSRLACEIQCEPEFKNFNLNSSLGSLDMIGTYKGKSIFVYPHLAWEDNSVYQITSDFIEYKVPKQENKYHKLLYYKIHSISPECKKYEVEATLHV